VISYDGVPSGSVSIMEFSGGLVAHDCARLHVKQQLIDDATARGWSREVERHQATPQRPLQLLEQLGESETR